MRKLILILCLLVMAKTVFAAATASTTEPITGFEDQDLSVLNEELRKKQETIDDLTKRVEALENTNALEFVSATTMSNVATVAFTDLAADYDYIFAFQNVLPASDGVLLEMRTNNDNSSSTFDDGASDYADSTTDTASSMSMSGSAGNAIGEGISSDIIVYNPGDTGTHTHCVILNSVTVAIDGRPGVNQSGAKRNEASNVDAVQFFFVSGNIASGTIRVYRRQLS